MVSACVKTDLLSKNDENVHYRIECDFLIITPFLMFTTCIRLFDVSYYDGGFLEKLLVKVCWRMKDTSKINNFFFSKFVFVYCILSDVLTSKKTVKKVHPEQVFLLSSPKISQFNV